MPRDTLGYHWKAVHLEPSELGFGSYNCLAEALLLFDEALTLDPSCAYAWNNRGQLLRTLGRLEEALESFDKAIKARRSYALAWENKGNVLNLLGRSDEALQCFDRADEINRETPDQL